MFHTPVSHFPWLSICLLSISIENSFLLSFWIKYILTKKYDNFFLIMALNEFTYQYIHSNLIQLNNFFWDSHSTCKCKDSYGNTSSILGAATLIPKHLLRMAGMTLLVDTQHRISLQVDMYFSMVRRRACWASFVSLSTSVKRTTEWRD